MVNAGLTARVLRPRTACQSHRSSLHIWLDPIHRRSSDPRGAFLQGGGASGLRKSVAPLGVARIASQSRRIASSSFSFPQGF